MNNLTNKSFKFVERHDDKFYTIELLEDFVGTKYQYGNVKMHAEVDEHGEEYGRLSFTWKLIEGDESLENDMQFQNYIGDVLTFVIQDALESGEFKIGDTPNESTDATDDNT